MMEEWRPVPFDGLEDIYEVSNLGRVRRRVKGAYFPAGRMLKPKAVRGYLVATLVCARRNIRRNVAVHQLVLMAFIGPRPKGAESCHNDGNRQNNRLENLRWDTPQANALDRIKHGTQASGDRNGARLHPERVARGERVPRAVLTEIAVRDIRKRYRSGQALQQQLADEYGVSQFCISSVVLGKTWKHVGA